MEYDGFITLLIRVEHLTGDRYRATTEGERRGPQSVEFTFPFSPAEQSAWLDTVRRSFQPPAGRPDSWQVLQEGGSTLFTAIFQGENLATWRVLHDQARRDNLLLRVVLDLGAPALDRLPWEALYDPVERFFLGRDRNTCIVRYPRDAELPIASPPRAPIRVLAMIASPLGLPVLDAADEKARLETALAALVGSNAVDLTWIDGRSEPATLDELAREIRRAADTGRPYHVFHYIGHASWDGDRGQGVLLLEDARKEAAPVTAFILGELLRGGGLRLALLNACEGSRTDEAEPFRSVAASLTAGADLPAVIANQIAISDRAARIFASEFYGTLAERRTVEEAVVAARHAVSLTLTRNPEWVATVYFSRFARAPFRLLPSPFPLRWRPLLFVLLLALLTSLMGITVVSLFRVFGPLVGTAFQVGIWLIAATFAYDRRDFLRREWRHVLAALAGGTLLVTGWFLIYQPTLYAVAPPRDFALSLESPTPLVIDPEQVTTVTYSVTIRGEATGLPAEHYLWALVQAENSASYVPGGQLRFEEESARFLAEEVVVGPPASRHVGNRLYLIQPVLVDEAGHRFLTRQQNAFWRFFHPDIRVVPQPRLQGALVRRR